MPAYSFQLQFCSFVEEGSKTHTIRGKRKQRPRPGQTFFGYYAMRTKQCRKLVEAPLTRVEDIVINPGDGRVWMADVQLSVSERNQFAWQDGFRKNGVPGAWDEMMAFWAAKHPGITLFDGDLIHWDFSRREFPKVKHD